MFKKMCSPYQEETTRSPRGYTGFGSGMFKAIRAICCSGLPLIWQYAGIAACKPDVFRFQPMPALYTHNNLLPI